MSSVTSPPDEDLWALVQAAFPRAPTRAKAIGEADRILRKDFPNLPPDYISEDTCTIRREWYRPAELRTLKLRHSGDRPQQDDGPIIVVEYFGARYVVDGTKRTNQRIKARAEQAHEVLVITRPFAATTRS